jgi:hypothetical protein
MTHNISKMQLYITCGFGDTTDLDFTFFMQKLLGKTMDMWTCFTEVVVFFTRRPTKLGFHFYDFSMFFYGFYKNQQKPFTI